MVKLEDVVAARERIRGNVAVTPCRLSEAFTELCGAQIYFKLENLQRTGSFNERGAAQTKGPGGYSKVTEEPLSGASTRRRSLNVLRSRPGERSVSAIVRAIESVENLASESSLVALQG